MIVYKSQYCSIAAEPGKRLLSVVWFKKSIDLDQEQVKSEITNILDYITEYSITSIIVDSRNYPFRENDKIQSWINHTYMPQIIESGIVRYAIIVESKIRTTLDDLDDLDEEGLVVEYFTDPEQARQWITS